PRVRAEAQREERRVRWADVGRTSQAGWGRHLRAQPVVVEVGGAYRACDRQSGRLVAAPHEVARERITAEGRLASWRLRAEGHPGAGVAEVRQQLDCRAGASDLNLATCSGGYDLAVDVVDVQGSREVPVVHLATGRVSELDRLPHANVVRPHGSGFVLPDDAAASAREPYRCVWLDSKCAPSWVRLAQIEGGERTKAVDSREP